MSAGPGRRSARCVGGGGCAVERPPHDDRRDRVGRAHTEARLELVHDALHRAIGLEKFLCPANRCQLASHADSSTGLPGSPEFRPISRTSGATCTTHLDRLRYIAIPRHTLLVRPRSRRQRHVRGIPERRSAPPTRGTKSPRRNTDEGLQRPRPRTPRPPS